MPDRNPIVGAATVLAALLTDVEAAGLPLPYRVGGSDYAPPEHSLSGRVGSIDMLIEAEHLAEWSVYLGAVPWANDSPHEGYVHTHVDGVIDGVAVRATALVPVADMVAVPFAGKAS